MPRAGESLTRQKRYGASPPKTVSEGEVNTSPPPSPALVVTVSGALLSNGGGKPKPIRAPNCIAKLIVASGESG